MLNSVRLKVLLFFYQKFNCKTEMLFVAILSVKDLQTINAVENVVLNCLLQMHEVAIVYHLNFVF